MGLALTEEQLSVRSLASRYRSSVATTIYGGRAEVLRSLIAEQRLGLPRSRRRR
jgi:hypothetical protein